MIQYYTYITYYILLIHSHTFKQLESFYLILISVVKVEYIVYYLSRVKRECFHARKVYKQMN